MGIGAAIAGAAVVGAGASIASGKSAAKTAKKTAASNNALETTIYNENKDALSPYEAAGAKANTAIASLLGLNGSSNDDVTASQAAYKNWQDSTGYQFQVDQGLKSVQAALGAKGLLDSGAALKSLTNYGQQTANSNFQTYLGDLTGQQGVGLTAASAQAGVGQNYANAVSANNNTAASAQENAALNTGNQINSALGSALGAYGFESALGSSYGSGGSYSSSAATAPQYGYGPWTGFK